MAIPVMQDISEQLVTSQIVKDAIMLGKESSIVHALTSGPISGAQAVVKKETTAVRNLLPYAVDTDPYAARTDLQQIDGMEKTIRLDSDVLETRHIRIPFIIPNVQLSTAISGVDIEDAVARMAQINIKGRLDRDLVESLTIGAFSGLPATVQDQQKYNAKPSYYRLSTAIANYTYAAYSAHANVQAIVQALPNVGAGGGFSLNALRKMVRVAEGCEFTDSEQSLQAPDLFMGGNTYSKGYILLLHPLAWSQLVNDATFQQLYIARGVLQAGAPQVLTGENYKGMVEGVHIFVSNQMRFAERAKNDGTKVTWNLLLGSQALHWHTLEGINVSTNSESEIRMDEKLRLKISSMYGMKSGQIQSILGKAERFDYGVVHNFSATA